MILVLNNEKEIPVVAYAINANSNDTDEYTIAHQNLQLTLPLTAHIDDYFDIIGMQVNHIAIYDNDKVENIYESEHWSTIDHIYQTRSEINEDNLNYPILIIH